MNDLQLFFLSLFFLPIGWILIAFLPSNKKSYANIFFVALTVALTSIPSINVLMGKEFQYVFPTIKFFGEIPLRIDTLSAWFILIINFTSLTGAIYGSGYMKPYSEQKSNLSFHWIQYLLFHSSMIWVCVVQNSLVFLIVWELMSLSSLMLVMFDYQNNKTIKAGLNYLVQMHIGVAFLSIAFIWIYFAEGSLDFIYIKEFFIKNSNIWLFLLFFVGFGIKAGFIPLHSWLPHAHPAAPSHISGVMSGVIVKVGIYGIFRMITFLQQDYLIIGQIVLGLSLSTGLYGIINSAVHRDFKKMLAYCTIENIGIIGSGVGLGLIGIGTQNPILVILGFSGALLHTLNHSLFKSLLFFSAGSVYQQTHTKDMEKLGGLIKNMPQTAFLFIIGALSIGGLPPFNGFVSEFILYQGFLNGMGSSNFYQTFFMIMSIAAFAIIGGISMFAFTKSVGVIFLGSPRYELHAKPKEVSLMMRLPQYFIVAIMLSIGIFPAFYINLVLNVISGTFTEYSILPSNFYSDYFSVTTSIGRYSLLLIALIAIVYFIRSNIEKRKSSLVSSTWGCGYVAPNVSMQYTGKSYSKTLGKLLSTVVFERKKYKEIKDTEIFPNERTHSAFYTDFFEFRFIDNFINRFLYFMDLFQFIQNGRLQQYILYGLLFIIVVFLGTYLGII
ncbi:MAG TPA: hypothetical protein DDX39_07980 [Bacteroidales bacterium]|nr:MAG: hypothetical protein A2W98_00150 [Bacteroidetes bacterium GWF2_33_38]OFY91579.1 MAG: hypothetical protein A2236_05905 [Bacteroidetes bacterium RIFOXYA2_FULL_33_7]HBF88565.1 hypothetical protein [Bacteroidales bacterium]